MLQTQQIENTVVVCYYSCMTEQGSHEQLFQRQVIEHLLHISTYGEITTADPQFAGIHGTSWETIVHIINNGVLPGKSYNDVLEYIPGDISIYPNPALFPVYRDLGLLNSIDHDGLVTPEESREITQAYAQEIAQRHGFLNILHLPIGNVEDDMMSAGMFDIGLYEDFEIDPESLNYFLRKGFSEEAILKARAEALSRKGFLIGISAEVAKGVTGVDVLPGDTWEDGNGIKKPHEDLRIRTYGKGLSYTMLAALEPLGDFEQQKRAEGFR